jgi:outer membrane protein assembly factor BamD
MVRVKYSNALVLAMAVGALLLTACSSTPVDKTIGMSPNAIHAEAKEEMSNSQWDKAIPLLEKLEARAAGTVLAQQAQLDKAYAHFKNGEQAQALATLDRFIKLHPASPALDYALYLKAIVNFNDDLGLLSSLSRQDLSERDQKAAKESFESFKELVARFPASKYATDARHRMTYIVNSLAQYEVHVARYYYRRGAYLAAINRAQIAVTDYPDVPAMEESLFILYKSYDALGMVQLRDDTKRVLEKNYPQSEFFTTGIKTVRQDPWWKLW